MKKILMILFLFVITLYANDAELNTSEKQALLEWVNTNCYENHKSFESLSKDRYFKCKAILPNIYQNELKGSIEYESSPDLMTTLLAILFSLAIIGLIFFIFNVMKNFYKDNPKMLKVLNFQWSIYLISLGTMGISILTIVPYRTIKDYTIETIRNGNLEDVKKILPIFELIKKDETALLLAVSNGSLDIVKYLVEEKKYNPNEIGKIDFTSSNTPLDLALSNESFDIAEYLKQYIPKDKPVDIQTASKSFDMNLLQQSIKMGNYSQYEILNSFIVSIEYKDNNATKYLSNFLSSTMLEKEGNISSMYSTPLETAIDKNNLEAIKLLVSKNINVNKCGVLDLAAFQNRAEIFNYLIENGADINLECPHEKIFNSIVRGRAYDVEKIVVDKGLIDEKEFKKVKEYGYY